MSKNDSLRGSGSPKTGKKVASGEKTHLRRSDEPGPSSAAVTPVIEDITKDEWIEEARRETVPTLRTILDTVPVGISYFNTKEQFQFANQRYEFLLGIKSDALIGTTLEQAIGKKPYQVAGKFAKRALKGEAVGFENVLRPSASGEISVLVSYVPDVGPDDVVRGFYALVEDISEHKRLQAKLRDRQKDLEAEVSKQTSEIGAAFQALKLEVAERRHLEKRVETRTQELEKSEAVLNEAQRIAKIGSWEWNIETNELWWSDEAHRMYGTDRQSFGANDRAFLERVHPDDRKLIGDSILRALDKHKEYCIDHRIITVDGTEKIVHERAEFAFDADGCPIRMIGTVQDITGRKSLETALQVSERRVRRLQADLHHVTRVSAMGEMASTLAHELNQPLEDSLLADLKQRLRQLTVREHEVFELVVMGKTNKEVALKLGISPRTVEVHRARVGAKLNARGLSDLVRFAIRAGILP